MNGKTVDTGTSSRKRGRPRKLEKVTENAAKRKIPLSKTENVNQKGRISKPAKTKKEKDISPKTLFNQGEELFTNVESRGEETSNAETEETVLTNVETEDKILVETILENDKMDEVVEGEDSGTDLEDVSDIADPSAAERDVLLNKSINDYKMSTLGVSEIEREEGEEGDEKKEKKKGVKMKAWQVLFNSLYKKQIGEPTEADPVYQDWIYSYLANLPDSLKYEFMRIRPRLTVWEAAFIRKTEFKTFQFVIAFCWTTGWCMHPDLWAGRSVKAVTFAYYITFSRRLIVKELDKGTYRQWNGQFWALRTEDEIRHDAIQFVSGWQVASAS